MVFRILLMYVYGCVCLKNVCAGLQNSVPHCDILYISHSSFFALRSVIHENVVAINGDTLSWVKIQTALPRTFYNTLFLLVMSYTCTIMFAFTCTQDVTTKSKCSFLVLLKITSLEMYTIVNNTMVTIRTIFFFFFWKQYDTNTAQYDAMTSASTTISVG